jgi:hypothetical protein
MPIHRERYPKDWNAIAHSVKSAAGWKCQHCGKVCLRPGEKPKTTNRSEWTHMVLTVHHADFTPENNNQENLIPLCAPCHLALHARTKRSNTSPGQLSLWWQFSHRYSFGTSARRAMAQSRKSLRNKRKCKIPILAAVAPSHRFGTVKKPCCTNRGLLVG